MIQFDLPGVQLGDVISTDPGENTIEVVGKRNPVVSGELFSIVEDGMFKKLSHVVTVDKPVDTKKGTCKIEDRMPVVIFPRIPDIVSVQ